MCQFQGPSTAHTRLLTGTFLWNSIINNKFHRPHSEQFSLQLLSTEDIVPEKTVDSKVYGLSRVMGTVILEKDGADELS